MIGRHPCILQTIVLNSRGAALVVPWPGRWRLAVRDLQHQDAEGDPLEAPAGARMRALAAIAA